MRNDPPDEPAMLRLERTDEEKRRRHKEGDKGAKFSRARHLCLRTDGIANTLPTMCCKDTLIVIPDRRADE